MYTCRFTHPSTYEVEVGDREDGLEFLALPAIHDSLQNQCNTLWNVLVEQFDELLPVCLGGLGVHPAFPVGFVAEVLGIDKHHTTSGHCGWTGIL